MPRFEHIPEPPMEQLTRTNRLRQALSPGRLGVAAVVVVVFLLVNALVRLGLAVFNGDVSVWLPHKLLPTMLIGAAFDLCAALMVVPLLALVATLWPRRAPRSLGWVLTALLLPLTFLMVFTAFSEFTFWNEFASRFNFIAVDYLIYTNEVIGNIRESYNLPLLLSCASAVTLLIWWPASAALRRMIQADASHSAPRRHWLHLFGWLLAPVLAWGAMDARYKEFSDNAQINELAGNGYFDFFHAFWTNEIDYDRFYKTLPRDKALATLAGQLNPGGKLAPGQRAFERDVKSAGPEKKLNVVLISVESFSAEFMGTFGNTRGLTPKLDQLAKEGMLFTHLYATGTRTVRGLEALSLSVPPTPGHSIVKRPNNSHLFSMGSVLNDKGYESIYLYGGYGYFDNMNAFYSGNDYTVVDRTALKPEEIHFENIWGVADEDLFTLSLRELDARQQKGKPFFAHIMTTTNHRPFTYPEGRIDIPSKSGRDGGVKYTDFAIGQFIEKARQHPWFDDTVFVIIADHTHNGRGKQELPIANYHIPMIIYAPKHVAPSRVDTITSQIDVAPTLLGMLNMSYRSRFFGHDVLHEGAQQPRALMANYQTVGYYENGIMVELKPNARYRLVDAATGKQRPMDAQGQVLLERAISYYQVASEAYQRGELQR
jgi:phosphoglycerol transferase MdoB-like AlkP superfamily enzyme